MRLQEALETAKQGSFFSRLAFDPANWLLQMKFSPALAAAILILGFAGGLVTMHRDRAAHNYRGNARTRWSQAAVPTDASIAGISSIVQDPSTNQVSIKYNTVSTQEAQGPLNDQKIQQLLLYAARNNYNSGVRVDSVGPAGAASRAICRCARR